VNALEDKRVCPGCGLELHDRPYVMSRRADRPALDPLVIVLVAVFAAAAVPFQLLGG
jgi:hypothetical protein